MPARFVGRVDGATATVSVVVTDTTENTSVVLGPVVVTWGTDPRMGPCPICRRPIVTQRSSRLSLWTRLRATLSRLHEDKNEQQYAAPPHLRNLRPKQF